MYMLSKVIKCYQMLSNVSLGYQKLSNRNYITVRIKAIKSYQKQVQAIKWLTLNFLNNFIQRWAVM